MNTDLTKIAQDMRAVAPDYFLNVPATAGAHARAVDEQLWQAGGVVRQFTAAPRPPGRGSRRASESSRPHVVGACESAIFPTIRKKMIGRI